MEKIYVQYGCGLSAPEGWINFDASPTLRIQKTPLIGVLLKPTLNTIFPKNVKYGDIVRGLPLKESYCDAVYCSHVLEHLALDDFRTALNNTFKILKPGGIFRCVVPDLETITKRYLNELETKKETASINFIGNGTLLGVVKRPKGMRAIVTSFMGNSHHLWMWDHYSLTHELKQAGFINIRKALFNDSADEKFKSVENPERFEAAVALECSK
jgi:predicted SAM-dependent methyltransferase